MTDDDGNRATAPLVAKEDSNCAKILPKTGACTFKANCNSGTDATINHQQQLQKPPPNNIQPQQTETNGNNNLKNGGLKPLHYG